MKVRSCLACRLATASINAGTRRFLETTATGPRLESAWTMTCDRFFKLKTLMRCIGPARGDSIQL